MSKIIEIKNVDVVFNKTSEKITSFKEYFISLMKKKIKKEKFIALKNINIEINSGEIVGLLGLNGAGKTTTFYTVCGLVKQMAA